MTESSKQFLDVTNGERARSIIDDYDKNGLEVEQALATDTVTSQRLAVMSIIALPPEITSPRPD